MTAGKREADANAAETQEASNPREMTGAEMVIQALIDQGVESIFGYPGGAVLPLYDVQDTRRRAMHVRPAKSV